MYELGRIAMPLFGFVLAYNLARSDSLQKGMHVRAMQRLFIFGLLAAPFFIALKMLAAAQHYVYVAASNLPDLFN